MERRDFLKQAGIGAASLLATQSALAGNQKATSRTGTSSVTKHGMTLQEKNKAIVAKWFDQFWGKTYQSSVIEELAHPDMLLKYSLHEPRKGHADIKAFMKDFRAAFPDLGFSGTADLIAEGDFVVGRWVGGGTHTGPAFADFLVGSLPAATGRKMWFSGTTILRVVDGKILQEIGLDDGLTAMRQLKLIEKA
jgi:predicted ester cyclase